MPRTGLLLPGALDHIQRDPAVVRRVLKESGYVGRCLRGDFLNQSAVAHFLHRYAFKNFRNGPTLDEVAQLLLHARPPQARAYVAEVLARWRPDLFLANPEKPPERWNASEWGKTLTFLRDILVSGPGRGYKEEPTWEMWGAASVYGDLATRIPGSVWPGELGLMLAIVGGRQLGPWRLMCDAFEGLWREGPVLRERLIELNRASGAQIRLPKGGMDRDTLDRLLRRTSEEKNVAEGGIDFIQNWLYGVCLESRGGMWQERPGETPPPRVESPWLLMNTGGDTQLFWSFLRGIFPSHNTFPFGYIRLADTKVICASLNTLCLGRTKTQLSLMIFVEPAAIVEIIDTNPGLIDRETTWFGVSYGKAGRFGEIARERGLKVRLLVPPDAISRTNLYFLADLAAEPTIDVVFLTDPRDPHTPSLPAARNQYEWQALLAERWAAEAVAGIVAEEKTS